MMNDYISREETEKLYELNKLEEYLKVNNIPYERIDEEQELTKQGWWHIARHQIAVPNFESLATGENEFDVICHKGSYGYEDGLLEIMGSIVWDEIKDEIIEKLDNPTNEQIAEYIEKAYKMGYCKGLDVGIEAFTDLKNKLKYGVKDYKESEGVQ